MAPPNEGNYVHGKIEKSIVRTYRLGLANIACSFLPISFKCWLPFRDPYKMYITQLVKP